MERTNELTEDSKCIHYQHCISRRKETCVGFGEESCLDYVSMEEASYRHDLDFVNNREHFFARLMVK